MFVPIMAFIWIAAMIAILATFEDMVGFVAFTCLWIIMAAIMIAWEQKRGGGGDR